jgi:hypothetical protein
MKQTDKPSVPEIIDEPGMAERFQRGLQRAFTMHPKPPRKPKEHPAGEGRLNKDKTKR